MCFIRSNHRNLSGFEVADVHVSTQNMNSPRSAGSIRNGRYDFNRAAGWICQNFSLKNLVMLAWDLGDDMVSGPKWIETERFDIEHDHGAAGREASELRRPVISIIRSST